MSFVFARHFASSPVLQLCVSLLTSCNNNRIASIDGSGLILQLDARGFTIGTTVSMIFITMNFVFFEGLFNRVRWLAFTFDVIWMVFLDAKLASLAKARGLDMTYDTRPTLIVSTIRNHHIVALLVVVSATKSVLGSGWNGRHSIKWSMPFDCVADVLEWCSSEGFVVGAHDCSYRTVLVRSVPCQQSGVVWPFVMISSCWSDVQFVD